MKAARACHELYRATPLDPKDDPRGRLVEVLRPDMTEVGQVNMIWIRPGQERGRHYHKRSGEWFFVIAGAVAFQLEAVSPADGTITHCEWVELSGDEPTLVWVPSWVQHTLRNRSPDATAIVLVGLMKPFDESRDDVYQARGVA
jgi:dTDP-4-dehydrorhamnose 3,5-epimerase-like enzyme